MGNKNRGPQSTPPSQDSHFAKKMNLGMIRSRKRTPTGFLVQRRVTIPMTPKMAIGL